MTVHKKDVVSLLKKIAVYMELKGENPFKISAFYKAANALERDARSLSDIHDFTLISGIGKGTSAVIEEFIKTGESKTLQTLQKEVPEGLIPLLQLPGLGGKKIAKLYKDLGVVDIDSLKKACEEHKVQSLQGFGKVTEEKILAAIDEMNKKTGRLPLAYMLPIAEKIEKFLEKGQGNGIVRFSRAGSLRRMKETIKDLDFIIAAENKEAVRDYILTMPNITEIIAKGDTKISIELKFDVKVQVDFRIVHPKEFISALHHFTGSKEHNVKMRQLAKERGEKISEYGVEIIETGEVLTFESEKELYAHFQLPYIPPEVREDGEEVEKYKGNLISLEEIKGDLHMHSTWSDGAHSIKEMAEAAKRKGYKYIAITDHSQFLKVANGLTPDQLKEQKEEIDMLNEQYSDFTIFRGIEMDILPDGTLDYDDDCLKELDIVIASIHSNFSQPQSVIMKRLKAALYNNHVDIIAHPTGRLIGRREGYDVDIEMLLELAKETDTILELNANPNRLDLCVEHLKKAKEYGVKVVINTDAHSINMLEHMEIGVAYARKAFIQPDDVVNTWDVEQLKQFLKRKD
ncbi:DNA polymerase/3'-5' exonuclease PolX [Aeribacillus pallidus]|uniref:DNA polymerase/3'-5' exonuclease PolX n=1 Tax=Aeribacillus pallidus TaxID=33936 RepID=UPI00102383CF|nr:DNA polymerase/3'-5' exonuclease PolX [Aeribacillus pallidus]RZI53247.1 DNA polymerase/3'-5' exonuclease PolX [Aeribacillus pallidus]